MIWCTCLLISFLCSLRFPKCISIVQTLHNRYGVEVIQLFRKYERLKVKEIKASNHIQFLQVCISAGIVPKFIRFKLANKNLRRECDSIKKRLLRTEQRHQRRTLSKIQNEILLFRKRLACEVSRLDLCCLERVVYLTCQRESKVQKVTHTKKEKSLRTENLSKNNRFKDEIIEDC